MVGPLLRDAFVNENEDVWLSSKFVSIVDRHVFSDSLAHPLGYGEAYLAGMRQFVLSKPGRFRIRFITSLMRTLISPLPGCG